MKLLILCYDALDAGLWKQVIPPSISTGGTFMNYQSRYHNTVQSWSSIYSGLTAEEHGFPSGWDNYLKQGHRINDLPCVWQDIQDMGYSIGMFNLPLTYPVFPIKDWMVGGFPCFLEMDRLAYPRSIHKHIVHFNHYLDIFGQGNKHKEDSHPFLELDTVANSKLNSTDIYRVIVSLIENRINVFDSILSENPVDVGMVGYSYLDHAGHMTFNINGLYANHTVNMSIQPLIDIAKPDNIIIVSDHGGYFWADPNAPNDVFTVGFNHTKGGVMFVKGVPVDSHTLIHETDIKGIIIDVLNHASEVEAPETTEEVI